MLQKDIDNWFMKEVLPLESKLMAFLRNHWQSSDIVDLRQEIYIRVYEAAKHSLPNNTPAFVFTIARNLIFDQIRRKKVIAFDAITDFESLQLAFEEPSVEDRFSSRKELRELQAALKILPERCRRVFELRKIYGYSQREVAQKLGIAESTIEKQLSKGIRLIADALYSSGQPYADKVSKRGIAKKFSKQ